MVENMPGFQLRRRPRVQAGMGPTAVKGSTLNSLSTIDCRYIQASDSPSGQYEIRRERSGAFAPGTRCRA